jgi:streptogramin lyase
MKILAVLLATSLSALAASAGTTFTGFPNPSSIAFDGTNLWVVEQETQGFNTGAVVKINQSGAIIETVSIPGPDFLTQAAYDAGSRAVWVAGVSEEGPGTVTAVDVATSAILFTVDVGTTPFGVLSDGNGGIWVANEGGENVTKINAATGAVEGTFATPNHTPYLMAMDPADQTIWVSCTDRAVYLFDLAGGSLGDFTFDLNTFQTDTGIVWDGSSMWIADSYDNVVFRVNPTSGAIAKAITVGTHPEYVAFDGTYLWVPNLDSNNVTKVQTSTDDVASVSVGSEPLSATVVKNSSGTFIWVTNNLGSSITRFSASSQ